MASAPMTRPRRSWRPPRQQVGQQGGRVSEGTAGGEPTRGGEGARRSVLDAWRPAVLLHPQVPRSTAFGRGGVKGGGGPSLPRLLISALTFSFLRVVKNMKQLVMMCGRTIWKEALICVSRVPVETENIGVGGWGRFVVHRMGCSCLFHAAQQEEHEKAGITWGLVDCITRLQLAAISLTKKGTVLLRSQAGAY